MHPNPAAPRPEYREIDRDPQGFFFFFFFVNFEKTMNHEK